MQHRPGAPSAPMARCTLEEARRIAGEWRSLIDKGIDPAVVEEEAP